MALISNEWAQIKESTGMALTAIRTSKLRSILTLLGIVVGVFSIISVMTALGVLRNSIEGGLTQLGANTYQVQKFTVDFNSTPAQRHKMWNRKDITYRQALEVKSRSTFATAVGLEVGRGGRIVFWNGVRTNPNVQLVGMNNDALITNDLTMDAGRALTAEDMQLARPVAILGKTVAEKLFPPQVNPVGESIRIDMGVFQVVGVFAKKGGVLGGDQDNFVTVPMTTFFHRYGTMGRSLNIMIKVSDREMVDESIEETRAILRAARKVPPGEEDDFGCFTNDSLIKQFNDFTLYFRLGVLVVSSIALVAAGVGIMNIMLVSVTERTREIGIRKAIGARRREILSQFIIEAIILCEIGGAVGIGLGILGGNIVGLLLKVPAVIPWEWVGAGFVSCTLVGLVFGVYPAWKASMLDPVEALRYE
jgi:putative ABC transport system permease protein